MVNKKYLCFLLAFIVLSLLSNQIILAYGTEDFLLDILTIYNGNLTIQQKETVLLRISIYAKIIAEDKEKFIELAQKISNFDRKQQNLIYNILKNYLDNSKLKILFNNLLEIKEIDLNSIIQDKSGNFIEVNLNYSTNQIVDKSNNNSDNNQNIDNQSNKNPENEENNKNNTNDKNDTNTNNNNNKEEKTENNSEQQKEKNNGSNTDNNKQENKQNNETKKDGSKNQENNNTEQKKDKNDSKNNSNQLISQISGMQIPQIPEIFKQYSSSELEAFYKEGIKLYYVGDVQKAFVNFWICIYNGYNKENSSYYLALIYEKNKDYDSAIILYKNSIDLFLSKTPIDSKFVGYLYKRLGISYNQKKLYEEAILYLKKSIEYYPTDSEAYFQIGLSFYNLQNYDKAKEYFQKAYQLGYLKAMEYLQKLGS